MFIKLNGHRTLGTQKVLKSVDSYQAGIYFVLFSRSVVSDSFVTPWTVASQAPLSMGFPRQDYWILGISIFSSRDVPDTGVKSMFPAWSADYLPLSHLQSPQSSYI